MIIYIVERDNSDYRPEPQVFTDGQAALDIVKKEFSKMMEDLELSQEDIGTCDTFECLWYFSDNAEKECDFCGDALINYEGDRSEWRITKHDTEKPESLEENDELDYDMPSCTVSDYSPSNSWDASGMIMTDFISQRFLQKR